MRPATSIDTRRIRLAIVAIALLLHVLEGVWLNPFFAGIASPLIAAWIAAWVAGRSGPRRGA